ncbi:MAG: ribonuclease P protein component [Pseudomonadota bacterium]
MTPPETPLAATAGDSSPAVPLRLQVLKNRSEFLKAARARRQGTTGMMVQMRGRADGTEHVGVGFTCSRKIGNAVQRNRAKRRLREAARLVLPNHGKPGHDYVLIGRTETTASRPFDALVNDLKYALRKLHG